MIERSITDVLFNSVGAVSVAVVFLYYLDRNDKRSTDLIENHLRHSTDAMIAMSSALTKLVATIESLKRFMKNRNFK